ncbi:hypothetical protein ONZ45_g5724 [Pleurotus djamor]|nr:hypothetical protein ONZ45_g5724 [Pleurotus djamor]
MRVALILLTFAVVLAIASPDVDGKKGKKAKGGLKKVKAPKGKKGGKKAAAAAAPAPVEDAPPVAADDAPVDAPAADAPADAPADDAPADDSACKLLQLSLTHSVLKLS